jgi:hypothetical protein
LFRTTHGKCLPCTMGKFKSPICTAGMNHQTGILGKENRGDCEALRKTHLNLHGALLVRSTSGCLGTLEVCGGPRTLACGRLLVRFLFRLFSNVLFNIVRRWLHLEVRIRSFPSYLRFGGASSTFRGRVKFYVPLISPDLADFLSLWCGFKFGSTNLQVSGLAILYLVIQ